MTTVVRPSEADLSGIARRIGGPLSAEGAESWYRNDGAMLLQEVATLRQEAEAARHAFYEDGAQAEPGATLYEWAKAWKATSTGFWEKAHTKNLRAKIVELTRANEDAQAAMQALREEHERQVLAVMDEWAARREQVKQALLKTLGLL